MVASSDKELASVGTSGLEPATKWFKMGAYTEIGHMRYKQGASGGSRH